MAVIAVAEIHDGRGAGKSTAKHKSVRKYTRVWRVETNNRYDEASVIYPALPALGSSYPSDPGAKLKELNPKGDSKSKLLWYVTGQYETMPINENPLDDPIKISWSTKSFQRPYVEDRDGQAIMNSAGDPYDPPAEGDDDIWEVKVTRNLPAVPSWVLLYRNTVNSDPITLDGIPVAVGKAKLAAISIGEWQYRNDTAFRVLTMTIQVKDQGWSKRLLDSGMRERDAFDSTRRAPIMDRGKKVSHPVPLDGTGYRLANPSPTNSVFRTHDIYIGKPFAAILS